MPFVGVKDEDLVDLVEGGSWVVHSRWEERWCWN